MWTWASTYIPFNTLSTESQSVAARQPSGGAGEWPEEALSQRLQKSNGKMPILWLLIYCTETNASQATKIRAGDSEDLSRSGHVAGI